MKKSGEPTPGRRGGSKAGGRGRCRLDECARLRGTDRWLLADSLAVFRGERTLKDRRGRA
jgi:hypothetical protein